MHINTCGPKIGQQDDVCILRAIDACCVQTKFYPCRSVLCSKVKVRAKADELKHISNSYSVCYHVVSRLSIKYMLSRILKCKFCAAVCQSMSVALYKVIFCLHGILDIKCLVSNIYQCSSIVVMRNHHIGTE